jgi:hypothetical protein
MIDLRKASQNYKCFYIWRTGVGLEYGVNGTSHHYSIKKGRMTNHQMKRKLLEHIDSLIENDEELQKRADRDTI